MEQFDERFAELEVFVKSNGHARVPTKFVSGSVNLGSWVSYLRTRYRTRQLDSQTVALLESIGMEWGPLTPGPQVSDQARDQKILELRGNNMSLAAIGEEYGLSRQRVHQILKRAQ